jgi:hypothetical protein
MYLTVIYKTYCLGIQLLLKSLFYFNYTKQLSLMKQLSLHLNYQMCRSEFYNEGPSDPIAGFHQLEVLHHS